MCLSVAIQQVVHGDTQTLLKASSLSTCLIRFSTEVPEALLEHQRQPADLMQVVVHVERARPRERRVDLDGGDQAEAPGIPTIARCGQGQVREHMSRSCVGSAVA